jgi:signal transduction histidine kinase
MEHSAVETLVVAVTLHDNQIEVAVTDRGHGLSDPERLFEPFFSTKSEGLGMGLNICRTIIESHHGRLWAVSNPEGGTTFRFTLPCVSSLEAQKHLQSEELLT